MYICISTATLVFYQFGWSHKVQYYYNRPYLLIGIVLKLKQQTQLQKKKIKMILFYFVHDTPRFLQ